MVNIKSHFVFNRSQRNGIFVLIFLIIVLQLGYFFLDFSSSAGDPDRDYEHEITVLQRKIDSIKELKAAKDSTGVAPFNPNYISDYKGYTLGMSVAEIDRLHNFRARDRWINSVEEFQEVTGVSDSLLRKISPYFTFPEWVQNRNNKVVSPRPVISEVEQQDLNAATAEELQSIRGVGEVLSKRIVNYRKLLGGFNDEIQLEDVYGLSPEVVERITAQFAIARPAREKQDINVIQLIQLAELPYFNYETARELIRYRDAKGKIESFDELTDLKAFPTDKIDKIKLYLTIN